MMALFPICLLRIWKNIPSAEYFSDIAQAYREEIADLYSVGCRNIQASDSSLTILSTACLHWAVADNRDSLMILCLLTSAQSPC